METVTKLEATVAEWYKKAPHLPETARQWIAANSWWMALVAAIITSLTVLGILLPFLLTGAILATIGGVMGVAVGGLIIIIVLIWLIVAVVNVVLLGMAVNPLKRREKKGWNLIFFVILLNLLAIVVKVMFDFEFASLILGAFGSAVAGYFLFEIRDYFVAVRQVSVAPEAK